MSSFNFTRFKNNKKKISNALDTFKTTFANYETSSGSNYVTLLNMNVTSGSPENKSNDCKSACDGNSNCIAYSVDDNLNCSTYTSSLNMTSGGDTNINIIKNKENVFELFGILKQTNLDIIGFSEAIKTEIDNQKSDQNTDYSYDDQNPLNANLGANHAEIQNLKKGIRNNVALNEAISDKTTINSVYYRYMFFFLLAWLLLAILLYVLLNEPEGGLYSFIYLVLFITIFAIFTFRVSVRTSSK